RETTELAPDHDERLVGEETVCIPRLAEATEEARDQREAPARDRALHLGVVPVRVPGLYVAIDRELAASDQIVLDRPERALEGELEVRRGWRRRVDPWLEDEAARRCHALEERGGRSQAVARGPPGLLGGELAPLPVERGRHRELVGGVHPFHAPEG